MLNTFQTWNSFFLKVETMRNNIELVEKQFWSSKVNSKTYYSELKTSLLEIVNIEVMNISKPEDTDKTYKLKV